MFHVLYESHIVAYFSSDPGMYCDICDVAPHNTEDCPEQEQIYESLI